MKIEQIIYEPATKPRAPGLRRLQKTLEGLLVTGYTRYAYVVLSEEACCSSRYAQDELYSSLKMTSDLYNVGLPNHLGVAHTSFQTIFIWNLSYFKVGSWSEIPAQAAFSTEHNCLLEVSTLTEVLIEKEWL